MREVVGDGREYGGVRASELLWSEKADRELASAIFELKTLRIFALTTFKKRYK